MYRVIKIDLLLKYTAYLTVVLSMASYSLVKGVWLPDLSLFQVIALSSVISAVIILLLLTPYSSRKIWALMSFFKKDLFPDINGTWHGKVIMENGGEIEVRAVIRQSLLSTQIDMHGRTMKSITLETTPTIEQGQKKLYYMYRSTPKDPSRLLYNGSTLFDIRRTENDGKKILELSGYYYTDRKTIGRVSLKQVSNNPNNDVSFY
jgi:SMODS-associating 2TM, beta-strand rich effector domain